MNRSYTKKDVIELDALASLLDLMGGDPEDLEEIIGDYMEDAPQIAQQMVEAVAAGDTAALKLGAHTLKSNARDVGAARLALLCAELEQDCADGPLMDAPGRVQTVSREEVIARHALMDIDLASLLGPERS